MFLGTLDYTEHRMGPSYFEQMWNNIFKNVILRS